MIRHNLSTAQFMMHYYSRLRPELGNQAFLEVITHIALDEGLIQLNDLSLMSEYTRVLHKRSGPRKRLISEFTQT